MPADRNSIVNAASAGCIGRIEYSVRGGGVSIEAASPVGYKSGMDLFSRMLEAGPDEVLFGLYASPLRRLIGTGTLALLCLVVLNYGYEKFITGGGGLLPILLALAGLYGALRFWQASRTGLELTPSELRESGGRRIARVEDIVSVEREAFAVIKPANGFVIATRESQPAAMLPGIWWRLGKRIGIGGLTGAGEGKAMVELLRELIRRRDEESNGESDQAERSV